MRPWPWLSGAVLLLAGGAPAAGQDDAEPAFEPEPLERTAAIAELRAAITERAWYDDVDIELPEDEAVIVVTRDGEPVSRYDWIGHELWSLDQLVAERTRMRSLADDALLAEWEKVETIPPHDAMWKEFIRQAALLEILRRGGDEWTKRVRAKLAALVAWRDEQGDSTRGWRARDVEALLTLHRLTGAPDPLHVVLEPPDPCTFPALPSVNVEIVNRGEVAVMCTFGGSYRSGREARFHVEARNSEGRLLGAFEWPSMSGGGLRQRKLLHPGEAIATTLPLSNYVAPLEPGEYTLRVHYSDSRSIAGADGFVGSVTMVSKPFTLRVLARVVETTKAEMARVTGWIEALPTGGPVQLLDDPYGEWAYGLVPPESAAGKLLSAGWPAVPLLVEFVQRTDADPRRRAWCFAVLYGITGWYDPRGGVVGDWEQNARGPTEVSGGGFTMQSGSGTSELSSDAQAEWASAWKKVMRTVEVRVTK